MSEQTQTPPNTQPRRWKMSRRQFLIGLGSGLGLLAVGTFLGRKTIVREVRLIANQAFLTGDAPGASPPDNPSIWFEIRTDNITHIYVPKIEMGQGVHTSLAQIAADELELDWETVRVHQADTETGFDPGVLFTFGSTSVTDLYQPIREVAATMREMLREEAAAQLGVDVSEITCEGSRCFITSTPDSTLNYGDIVANRQDEWVIPDKEATLKPVSEFNFNRTTC